MKCKATVQLDGIFKLKRITQSCSQFLEETLMKHWRREKSTSFMHKKSDLFTIMLLHVDSSDLLL